MFGIGMPELFVIMAVALIVIGPKKLPDLARSIGRALGEFKKATGELKSSLGVDEELSDIKHAFDDINQEIKEAVNIDPLSPSENSPEPANQTENPPETENATESHTTGDTDEPDNESSEPKSSAADIDDTNTSANQNIDKSPGETAGDK